MRVQNGKRIDQNTREFAWPYGCSIAEVAEIMGLGEANVRVILRNALMKLRHNPVIQAIYAERTGRERN